jgi:hypothetical protein
MTTPRLSKRKRFIIAGLLAGTAAAGAGAGLPAQAADATLPDTTLSVIYHGDQVAVINFVASQCAPLGYQHSYVVSQVANADRSINITFRCSLT